MLADRVAVIFATRERSAELSGVRELVVEPLGDEDSHALLASTIKAPLDERVRNRIVAETGGNPLALLELPRGLTPTELAVGFGTPGKAAAAFLERSADLTVAPQRRAQRLLAAADVHLAAGHLQPARALWS